jgi:hypothetical protein
MPPFKSGKGLQTFGQLRIANEGQLKGLHVLRIRLEIYRFNRQDRPPVRTLANAGKTAQICFQPVPRKGYGLELVNIMRTGWFACHPYFHLAEPFDFASHSAL